MPRDRSPTAPTRRPSTRTAATSTWSFTINRIAPLSAQPPPPPPEPTTPTNATDAARYEPVTPFRYVDSRIGLRSVRLAASTVTEIQITNDPDILAVSANFVSTDSADAGYLTLYNCTSNRPEVSTLGYRPGDGRRQPGVRAAVERQDVPVLDERHRRRDRHQRLLPPWQRRRLHADRRQCVCSTRATAAAVCRPARCVRSPSPASPPERPVTPLPLHST